MKRALMVLVVVALAACGGDDGRTYPESVRDSFLVACAQTGGSDEGCECGLEAVEEAFTLSEFTALEQQTARTGELPQGILDAMREHCGTPTSTKAEAASVATTTTTAPSTHTSGDPVQRTVVKDPGRGLWVTTSGGDCYYELLRDGVIVENTVASTLSVNEGITSLQYSPDCTWRYDGFDSGD